MKNSQTRNALVKRAVSKFKALTFVDPISMQHTGKSRGILLNQQMYDARTMANWIERRKNVPHTRRVLTNAEIEKIYNVTNSTYTRRIARAAHRLRASLENWYENLKGVWDSLGNLAAVLMKASSHTEGTTHPSSFSRTYKNRLKKIATLMYSLDDIIGMGRMSTTNKTIGQLKKMYRVCVKVAAITDAILGGNGRTMVPLY